MRPTRREPASTPDSWSDDLPVPAGEFRLLHVGARRRRLSSSGTRTSLPFFVAGNTARPAPARSRPRATGRIPCASGRRETFRTGLTTTSPISPASAPPPTAAPPDLVAPGYNVSASSDFSIATDNRATAVGAGLVRDANVAGAAALVREYFDRGDYPSGAPAIPRRPFAVGGAPEGGADRVGDLPGRRPARPWPPPSSQQGFGRNNPSRVLAFPESPFRLLVADRIAAFTTGSEAAVFPITVRWPELARVTLAWTDPPGVPRSADDSTLSRRLSISRSKVPGGGARGNGEAGFDRINNVEQVTIEAPVPGIGTIRSTCISSPPAARGFALVATADMTFDGGPASPSTSRARHPPTGMRRSCPIARRGSRRSDRQPRNEPVAGGRTGFDREPRFGRPGADALPGRPSRPSPAAPSRSSFSSGRDSTGFPWLCAGSVPFG